MTRHKLTDHKKESIIKKNIVTSTLSALLFVHNHQIVWSYRHLPDKISEMYIC